jgi:hypothetical protein
MVDFDTAALEGARIDVPTGPLWEVEFS